MPTFKRMFWAVTWRLLALGVLALAIALSWEGLPHTRETASATASTPAAQHPQAATTVERLDPVAFGSYPVSWDEAGASTGDRLPGASVRSQDSPYTPREEIIPAHPSNYGPRYLTDINGNPATYPLIIVIHETVGSADSAIHLFQRNHVRDEDQVSYHSLIRRNGTIVHLVHPQMRAFGAGNSVFDGPNGPETVRTNPDLAPSVNNFAYHTSLETPGDGRGNQSQHSGYTEAQYQSLAWLIAHLPVPDNRITTHRAVDRSGTRRDPRSFNPQMMLTRLHAYPRNFENFQSPT